LLRSTAPRGRSQAGETAVRPERLEGADASPEGEDGPDPDADDTPSATPATNGPTPGTERPASSPSDEGSRPADLDTASEGSSTTSRTADSASRSTPDDAASPEGPANEGTSADDADRRASGTGSGPSPSRDAPADGEDAHPRRFRDSPTQSTLDGPEADGAGDALDVDLDRLPPMRVLGQVHDTYLVAETPDGLVLVDQHAADERVNYERLRERFAGDVTTQTLVDPVEVSVTPREAELFEAHGEALARLGFRASLDDGGERVGVRTVPAVLAGSDAPELVRDLLADFVGGDPGGTVEAAVDDLLGDMACYPAIKGNESLAEGSVVALLSALDDCENPYACPHGRPVLVELGTEEIEARFERDYPGHGGRRDS
jgi:DNA mismatch repair protein MutL